MAFSMHSHSGQFCPGHAKDSLEDIIQTAISKGMQTFAVTEHMARSHDTDRYPEEVSPSPSSHFFYTKPLQIEADHTIPLLRTRHEAFIIEADRLRKLYADQIKILIGFEAEWIRPSYAPLIEELAANPHVDYFIGSVHHVHEIPIDYDAGFYEKARRAAGGTDGRLFEDYFDAQFEMLTVLKPRVVGHFDLIRLLSDEPDRDLRSMKGVWEKVVRNLRVVVRQGGLLEINSSALRKGLKEPYPGRTVCEEFVKMGGNFTLSDDSHGASQVGTNFMRAFEYLESLGVKELFLFERDGANLDANGKRALNTRSVTLSSMKQNFKP